MSDLVTQICNQARGLIQFTIDEIKQKIIDEFFSKADQLVADIQADIIKLLDRIDETIYKLSCSERALVDQIVGDITKALPTIPNPFNQCRHKIDTMFPGHNLRWKFFSEFSPNEIYEYQKCSYFIDLTPTTPIASILMSYRDLEILAGNMRCISVALIAPENIIYYMEEMAMCVQKIDLYKSMNPSSETLLVLRSYNRRRNAIY